MQQFDRFYRVKRRDNLGDPEYWNRRFQDLDLRISRNEDALDSLDDVADRLEQIGLDRLNQSITPLVQETQDRLRSIANMFTALSLTTNEVTEGAKSFFVIEAHRNTFAAVDYVSVRATDDETQGVIGRVVSYNRETGELIIQAEQAMGEGTYHEWQIAISSPPDLVHAGRFDNPHNVTALQVGAYTQGEVDTALTTLRDTLNGGVATARDTLKKLSDLRDTDVAALNTAIANKSDKGHLHDDRYPTRPEMNALSNQSKMHGSVRLIFGTPTQLWLTPYDGGYLVINGVVQVIPWTGVTNAGLPANSYLYLYAYMSGPNVALAFSGTGPARGDYGIMTMSGNPAYTFVGTVWTNASAQFQHDSNALGVRSYFNESPRVIEKSLQAAASTASVNFVELGGASMRMIICTLGTELWNFTVHGECRSATVGNASYTGVMLDYSPWWTIGVVHHSTANYWDNCAGSRALYLSPGAHTISFMGQAAGNAGTSTWGAGTLLNCSHLGRDV